MPPVFVLCSLLMTPPVGATDWAHMDEEESWDDRFDREEYEEEAGPSFAVLVGPEQKVYGIHYGFGVWLKNTPVFGDYALSVFHNGVEDSMYSGIGLTLRLMPHSRLAPFAGAGGSYNYSLNHRIPQPGPELDPEIPEDRGASYWGGHAEAGVRWWQENRIGLLELMGRYAWTSLKGEGRDYWLIGFSTGTGF